MAIVAVGPPCGAPLPFAPEGAANAILREAAARVAEASIDVLRARRAKTILLERLRHDPAFQPN